MSTTLTPPPATPPAVPGAQPAPGPQRSAPRVVALLTAIAGGALLLFTVGTSVAGTVSSGAATTSTVTADTAGVSALAVDADAADVEISFAPVSEATLTVTGDRGADEWTLTRADDRLVVGTAEDWWSGWSLWSWGETTRATLVLPDRLAGLDAQLEVGAGAVRVAGEFGTLDVRVDAGSIDASGSSDALVASVSAGRASLELDDVREASVTVSAGRVTGTLRGAPLSSLRIDASAGGVELAVPAGRYAISSSEDAGSFSHRLDEDSSSRNRIDVRVSAGSVELTEAR